MSTRSAIGRLNADGTVDAIYCHFDGYLSNNGRILHEHYQDAAKVDALIALGDLSSLGAEIGEAHDFNARIRGQCNAYGRDRGEEGTEATHLDSLDLFLSWGADCANGYVYLYAPDGWRIYSPYIERGGHVVVDEGPRLTRKWRVALLSDMDEVRPARPA